MIFVNTSISLFTFCKRSFLFCVVFQKFLASEGVVAVSLAVEINVSGDLGIREAVVAQGGGGVDVFDESVADERDTKPLAGDVVRCHLLVKTKEDVGR